MRIYLILLILLMASLEFEAQHKSVLLIEGGGACEPSIKLDPRNPQRMVAGVILNHVLYSEDGGETWISDKLTSPYGVWGDPVMEVDTAGSFYYFHLSNPKDGDWIDRIVCQRSDDGGRSWTEGTFTGLNGSKEQDKHWSVVDQETNSIHLTWTEFDDYGSDSDTCMSRIQYSHSKDQGNTWSDARTISTIPGDCKDDDETVEGAVPAIGAKGEVYASWAGPSGLTFTRSLDGGDSWSKEVMIDPMPTGWNYTIPGLYRANGLPITKVDLSGGQHHGTIYVNWSDQRRGADNTDVWLSRSEDGGSTWLEPVRVNQDEGGAHQFFTWMDVDQATGNLYFVYYDRRDASEHDHLATQVYMSMSTDGGATFHDFPLESGRNASFVPKKYVFFGDYNNVSAHDGIVRPIWTRMDEGKLSVWTSIVDTEKLADRLFHLRPFCELQDAAELSLVLFKNDKKESVLLKKEFPAGRNSFSHIWEAKEVPKGSYELRLMRKKKVLWKSNELKINGKPKR